jgi:dTDP-4-dehydrorhamnose 3,5-epimerase
MKFNKTSIQGVTLLENIAFKDHRGMFVKMYQQSIFNNNGIDLELKEHFFSVSDIGVIRGMHFQAPPYAQEKFVYVPAGKIIDVILDLRVSSETYGKFITVELSGSNNNAVFIPKGCAHGFQSLEKGTITVYMQSAEYNPECDTGINPLLLGINWPVQDFIISEKDKNFTSLESFQSPFRD